MVNIDMREYTNYRQSTPPGAHLPLAAQSARRPGIPNTQEFSIFENSLCKQIRDSKHAFLIAWLIAWNKRTNFDLSGLDSARSAFLIVPKSSNFSPYNPEAKLVPIFAPFCLVHPILRHALTCGGARPKMRSNKGSMRAGRWISGFNRLAGFGSGAARAQGRETDSDGVAGRPRGAA